MYTSKFINYVNMLITNCGTAARCFYYFTLFSRCPIYTRYRLHVEAWKNAGVVLRCVIELTDFHVRKHNNAGLCRAKHHCNRVRIASVSGVVNTGCCT